MTALKLKRAYEPSSPDDGFRVYVDRLWPRGLSHETFRYDLWTKDISPSTELREWFHADPSGRWDGFVEKYKTELAGNPAVAQLAGTLKSHTVATLLFSSHDPVHDNAAVLASYLAEKWAALFRKDD